MSYVQSHADPAARAKAVLVVGGVHALLGAGLILGLTYTGIITGDEDLTAITFDTDIPEDIPPPPPDDVIEPVDAYIPPVAPTMLIDLSPPTAFDPIPFTNDPPPLPVDRDPTPLPTPSYVPPQPTASPAPRFDPLPPRVRNRQAEWISSEDYSNTDIRRENEGTATYRLVVGSNGRVEACEITASTGHDSLDAATCRLIARRARFDAAKDEDGRTVVGTFTGQVTWQIPD